LQDFAIILGIYHTKIPIGKVKNMALKPVRRLAIIAVVCCAMCLLALAGPAQAAPPPGGQLPPLVRGQGKTDALSGRIAQLLQRELAIADLETDWSGSRLFETRFADVSPWVDRQVLVAYRGALLLVGAGENPERTELLATTKGEVLVNTAKLAVYRHGDRLTVWSQRPFRAAQLTAIVEWDGRGLNVVSREYRDPTVEYYDTMAALLQAGQVEAAMAATAGKGILYPSFYRGYYEIPQLALLKAHEYALAKYRTGATAAAARILKWGLDQYLSVQVYGPLAVDGLDRLDRLAQPGDSRAHAYRVDFGEFVAALNDYAFFLAETGQISEAESYLRKVAALAPGRLAVYLNLGDVCWDLGKQQEAKEFYRRYLALLADKNDAPPRVLERI
jgi:tetratricopeptide (TPR) repeat protein